MQTTWNVLLIGGSTGTGKSYLARQLAQHYHVPLIELDDIRLALQEMVSKETYPDFFFFEKNPNYLETYESSQLVERLFKVGEIMWPALDKVISNHIACKVPVIIEGDSILPNLIKSSDSPSIKTLFLYDEESKLQEKMKLRGRGVSRDPDLVKRNAAFSYSYGQNIKDKAESLGFSTFNASSINLLEDVINYIDS